MNRIRQWFSPIAFLVSSLAFGLLVYFLVRHMTLETDPHKTAWMAFGVMSIYTTALLVVAFIEMWSPTYKVDSHGQLHAKGKPFLSVASGAALVSVGVLFYALVMV